MSKEIRVFMDILISKQPAGRLVFNLYKDVPMTSENFRSLCTGERGLSSKNYDLSYKRSLFFRVIPNFMMQGGDITENNGLGGVSIYGSRFSDENFRYKHSKRGLLSMANSGFNTNNSQFFILFKPTPHLDGKHVVFGEMTQGFELLEQIEKLGTKFGNPLKEIKVGLCGQLD